MERLVGHQIEAAGTRRARHVLGTEASDQNSGTGKARRVQSPRHLEASGKRWSVMRSLAGSLIMGWASG